MDLRFLAMERHPRVFQEVVESFYRILVVTNQVNDNLTERRINHEKLY
jgi:hypothetical protein